MNKLYTFIKSHLLSNFAVTIGDKTLTPTLEVETPFGAVIELDGVKITAKIGEDAIVFALDATAAEGFAAENALTLTLGDLTPDALLGSRHDGPWWMYPTFTQDFAALAPKTQSLLVKKDALHYHMLPLCSGNFRAEFVEGKLAITSGKSGLTALSGDFLAVSASTDPFTAVKNNYAWAHHIGAIAVPLIAERTYPELFEGFGWCTWDAFYKEVSSANIYAKLAEFKEKGIKIHWLIIDDGWMTTNGRTLSGFEVNDHFPEGLKACIDRIKGEFGVEKVGVWHAFNGYWDGVDPESPLAGDLADCLFTAASGKLLPSLDPDTAFKFWDKWHTYLEDCGVDFLKVDNQSSNSGHLKETLPTAEGCRLAHAAIERSINKHFGGIVINCMGMDMENVLSRPFSAVSRNSDDFFPKRERGFIKHLVQNAYNAIWHNEIYHCDFDMWWSKHPSAIQSGVLRAISGSPIYVSDKIGESNAANIAPVVTGDGMLMRCDAAAKPTLDCLYTDCTKEGKLLKLWNRSGDAFAAAVFNVSDGDVTDTLDYGTIPGLVRDGDYIAYEYFTKKFTRVNWCQDEELTLPADGVAVYALYPVKKDGEAEYIELGDTAKYVPIAAKDKVKTLISELTID